MSAYSEGDRINAKSQAAHSAERRRVDEYMKKNSGSVRSARTTAKPAKKKSSGDNGESTRKSIMNKVAPPQSGYQRLLKSME